VVFLVRYDYHPCRDIHLYKIQSDEHEIILTGQGYTKRYRLTDVLEFKKSYVNKV
jgi:hypothetical protein